MRREEEIKDLTYNEKLELRNLVKKGSNLERALEGAISDEYQSREFRRAKVTLKHIENAMSALAAINIQEYLQNIQMQLALKQDRKRRRKLIKHYEHKAEKVTDAFKHDEEQQLALQQQLYKQLITALEQVNTGFKALWQKHTELTNQISVIDDELDGTVQSVNEGKHINKAAVQQNFQLYQDGVLVTQQIQALGELNLSSSALLQAIKGLNKKKTLNIQLDNNEAKTQELIDRGRAIYQQANEVGQQLGLSGLPVPDFLMISLRPRNSNSSVNEEQPMISTVAPRPLSRQPSWSQDKMEEIFSRSSSTLSNVAPAA